MCQSVWESSLWDMNIQSSLLYPTPAFIIPQNTHLQICTHAYPSHTHTQYVFFLPCGLSVSSLCVNLKSHAREESCLKAGTIAHSEWCTESSRTIHCSQLFKESCIISSHCAVNVVNGHYSLKVMTKQYAFTPIKTLTFTCKHKHTHLLDVHHVELHLYIRGSILLANTSLSKIYCIYISL